MVWLASILLILSYFFLGRKQMRTGWTVSALGNGIYFGVILHQFHRLDLCFLSGVFTVLSLYNLTKELV